MRDTITSLHFKNYKAFRDYSVKLDTFNVLVGPNNAGKSTVLGALRLLSEALRKAYSRNPEWLMVGKSSHRGYRVDLDNLPVSTENVFHNYDESEHAVITFKISNGNSLKLVFPDKEVCYLLCESNVRQIKSVSSFKASFDLRISFVPILGPVEHNERLYQKEAARLALLSSHASRNFRNIWYHFPEGFPDFREAIKRTWPGMDIEPPEVTTIKEESVLHMFCPEERYPREIFWAGFGFQVWSQMLTFILQAKDASLLVIDEPDIYLHSDLQRQLVHILQELTCPVVVATHSTEIISEVESDCILSINKKYRSARRVENTQRLQEIFAILGSGLNPALTQIAKTRRVVFVEGKDFQMLSRFARRLGLEAVANRADFAVIPVSGFNPNKVKDFSAGMEATLGCKLLKAVIFDRDYRSLAEISSIKKELDEFCQFSTIHRRKEIENFLLEPRALTRSLNNLLDAKSKPNLLEEDLKRILEDLTHNLKNRIQAQFVKYFCDFERIQKPTIDRATLTEQALNEFDTLWVKLESRLELVPGKEVFASLNEKIQAENGVHITSFKAIDAFHKNDFPSDLLALLQGLEQFRKLPTHS